MTIYVLGILASMFDGDNGMLDPMRITLCNCAGCGRELLGRAMLGLSLPPSYRRKPVVARRIEGRPYCEVCAQAHGELVSLAAILREFRATMAEGNGKHGDDCRSRFQKSARSLRID